jgi:hypothetical protein
MESGHYILENEAHARSAAFHDLTADRDEQLFDRVPFNCRRFGRLKAKKSAGGAPADFCYRVLVQPLSMTRTTFSSMGSTIASWSRAMK